MSDASTRKPKRQLTQRDREIFRRACRVLGDFASLGFDLYLDGTGNVHIMDGPSHDEAGRPRHDAIIETCNVPHFTGGDW